MILLVAIVSSSFNTTAYATPSVSENKPAVSQNTVPSEEGSGIQNTQLDEFIPVLLQFEDQEQQLRVTSEKLRLIYEDFDEHTEAGSPEGSLFYADKTISEEGHLPVYEVESFTEYLTELNAEENAWGSYYEYNVI